MNARVIGGLRVRLLIEAVREAAMQALTAFGPAIAPLLEKHRTSSDAEVRWRIERILSQK